jgi:alpha-galactosidase
LRRSVPLWRSDCILNPLATQCQTFGLALWVPYFGTGTSEISSYAFRSNMCPAINTLWDMRKKDLNYELLRALTGQWKALAQNFLGDYYPLTEYSESEEAWIAWQFDRPEAGEGMIQAFRRPKSLYSSAIFKLRGLSPEATYEVKNLDTGRSDRMSGKELGGSKGLLIEVKGQPGAAVITYRKL